MRKSSLFAKLLLAGVTLAFTAFAFLNTYEVIFNKDIAVATSLRKFGVQAPVNAIAQDFDIKPESDRETSNTPYTKLQSIQIPALSSTLYLEEKRVINGELY